MISLFLDVRQMIIEACLKIFQYSSTTTTKILRNLKILLGFVDSSYSCNNLHHHHQKINVFVINYDLIYFIHSMVFQSPAPSHLY